MKIAVVFISVAPPAPAPMLERALSESCSSAARPVRCEILEPSSRLVPTATVRWDSASRARVEVTGAGAAAGETSETRDVEFRPEDTDVARWQAVGLVVASLVDSSGVLPDPEVEPPRASQRAPASFERAIVWIDGGAALGRGLDPGALRLGGWLGGGYRLPGVPLFVGIGASFGAGAGSAVGLTGTWTGFTAQVGAVLEARPVDLVVRPRAGVVAERLVGEASGGPGREASGSRWLDGATLGAELVWPAREPVSLLVGADATWLSGGTAIRLDDRNIASFPALSWQALLGVQVALVSARSRALSGTEPMKPRPE